MVQSREPLLDGLICFKKKFHFRKDQTKRATEWYTLISYVPLVSLSCDVCINGNGYLKEHRSNCHHSIVPTVECYVYYNTLNKICPYKCLTDLTIINGGVEAKLNQMHAEAQTKLRIFGRIPLSESMLEDYITFAQGMGSADHIAKGKQLNKGF